MCLESRISTNEWRLAYNLSMITKTEAVWRHLLVRAEHGQRRFQSIGELARDLQLGVSTVHKALRRPTSMGAIRVQGSGGVRMLDPARVMLLWAGQRELSRDVLGTYRTTLTAPKVERCLAGAPFTLGGFGAVVSHERGNRFAAYDQVLCYGRPENLPAGLVGEEGPTTLTVLEADPWLARYGRVTPLSQAYVDLFNTPGWPAERFVHELNELLLAA